MSKYDLTITNPGAETGDLTGWTSELGAFAASAPYVTPYRGSYTFWAGNVAESIISQEIDLLANGVPAAGIDAGTLIINFSAFQASFNTGGDKGQLQVRFKNSGKTVLSTITNPLKQALPSLHFWEKRNLLGLIPANTRYVDLVLRAVRTEGTSNDGDFDDASAYVIDGTLHNLTVTNPGAESALTTGWTSEKGSFSSAAPYITPHSGTKTFYAGTVLESQISQELDLVTQGVDTDYIDTGRAAFIFSAWRASYDSNGDSNQMLARFKDNDRNLISVGFTRMVMTTPSLTWEQDQVDAILPVGCRYVDLVLKAWRTAGTSNDGDFDDVEAKVFALNETLEELDIDSGCAYSPSYGSLSTTITSNLHGHTTGSDGALTPQQYVDQYTGVGTEALAITDHGTVTTQPDGATVKIEGNELSPAGFHILSLFCDYEYVSGPMDAQTLINAIGAAGGIAVLAHPNWTDAGFGYGELASLTDYLGIEIHNSVVVDGAGGHYTDGFALEKWDDILSGGKIIWGFSNDDFHSNTYARTFNEGKNILFINSATLAEVRQALERGNFVAEVSNGGVTKGYPSISGNTISISCTGATAIAFRGKNGMLLKKTSGASASYDVQGWERYVRIEAIGDYTEGFGSALDANVWKATGGSWSVHDGIVSQVTATGAVYHYMCHRHIYGDMEAQVDVRLPSPDVTGKSVGLSLFSPDTIDTSNLNIRITRGNANYPNSLCILESSYSNAVYHSVTTFTPALDTWYTIKVQYTYPGYIRAKVWATGDAEPANWMAEGASKTQFHGGDIALRAYNTGDFDNLYVNGYKSYYQPIVLGTSAPPVAGSAMPFFMLVG